MDREDAAFAADTLDCRIAGDRGELNARAASSLMRLSSIAVHIRHWAGLKDPWAPALAGAAELMAIARLGGAVCDHPIEGDFQPLVDSLRKLAGEAGPNRAARRAQGSRIRAPHREILRIGKSPIVKG